MSFWGRPNLLKEVVSISPGVVLPFFQAFDKAQLTEHQILSCKSINCEIYVTDHNLDVLYLTETYKTRRFVLVTIVTSVPR